MLKILVFVEQREGKLKKCSLEVLSEARRLAVSKNGTVAAVATGSEELIRQCAAFGAEKIYTCNHTSLTNYSTEGYTELLARCIQEYEPTVFLAAASAMGKELLPRVAARLDVSMAQDCIQIQWDHDQATTLELTRPIFAGKAFATIQLTGIPQIVSLRPNIFAVEERPAVSTEVVSLDPHLKLDTIRAQVVETQKFSGQTMELTEADIIVSGGRGMKGPENWHLIQSLAESMNAATGASRAVVDAGWVEHRFQVGQTGKTVSPTLYIACGISGSIQHLAGMSSSKYILAVNKDPDAPIFKVADFGIIGDTLQVLPLFTREVNKIRKEN
jgi:electron transfer flavoprotein alpha subunit